MTVFHLSSFQPPNFCGCWGSGKRAFFFLSPPSLTSWTPPHYHSILCLEWVYQRINQVLISSYGIQPPYPDKNPINSNAAFFLKCAQEPSRPSKARVGRKSQRRGQSFSTLFSVSEFSLLQHISFLTFPPIVKRCSDSQTWQTNRGYIFMMTKPSIRPANVHLF